jgi:AcrR family transcriptional regulator
MANDIPGRGRGASRSSRRKERPSFERTLDAQLSEALQQYISDTVTQKIAEKAAKQADKIAAKAAHHAEHLDRLSEHFDAFDLWTRTEPGRRRARFTRADIAAVALRIADAEGLEAVSMRRIATELGAGTMTLYHYVRTKDELFALLTDAVMAELVVPADEPLPQDWRRAMSIIAGRSRDALRRHPWILDIADDPSIGPNAVRHFDQSMQAVASLPGPLTDKLDVITAVDEYVFGFCIHERSDFHDDETDEHILDYVVELVATGDYPQLAEMIDTLGIAPFWAQIQAHARDESRFERNLARLLDGIERSLPS